MDPTLEALWAAHVDRTRRCLHLSRHPGVEASAPFPLKAIVLDAIEHDSAGILLAHNHPSGDAQPSDSDCRATRRLVTVAEALDCVVLDHLVFAGGHCTSFRQMGLL
jgi:DNA repair protein RadC